MEKQKKEHDIASYEMHCISFSTIRSLQLKDTMKVDICYRHNCYRLQL